VRSWYTDVRVDLFKEDWRSCLNYLVYREGIGLKIFSSKIWPESPYHHLSSFDVITNLSSF